MGKQLEVEGSLETVVLGSVELEWNSSDNALIKIMASKLILFIRFLRRKHFHSSFCEIRSANFGG